MATGSGKTLIMAGLILYLYQQGYRNFLFFVNSTNIIDKTRDNFLNETSIKYLFNKSISFGDREKSVSKQLTIFKLLMMIALLIFAFPPFKVSTLD
jgi:type III restriction enzyme